MTTQLPRAVTQQDLEEAEGTPGITRKVVFETDNNKLVQAHAEGGVSSGWHHHGDRHVYAHLVEGTAVIEYGSGGNEHLDVETGGFFYLPPRVVHRDVNPTDEPQRWIISFVGTGPLVKNVDGPDPE
ncbi:cupin domain-containing protein (plasmid) [Haloferax sp. S1W]|uniref:cupin domain-containing protein n=1 Tax=Haloferax sp. S1W TaxID=3377110 RepID=UPI0037CB0FAA